MLHKQGGASTHVTITNSAPFLHGAEPCFVPRGAAAPCFCATWCHPSLCLAAWWHPVFMAQGVAVVSHFCTPRHGSNPFSRPEAHRQPVFAPRSHSTSTSEGVCAHMHAHWPACLTARWPAGHRPLLGRGPQDGDPYLQHTV